MCSTIGFQDLLSAMLFGVKNYFLLLQHNLKLFKMKKIILPIALLSIITLASCSKERTCSCDTTLTDSGNEYDVEFIIDPITFDVTYRQKVTPYSETFSYSGKSEFDKIKKSDANAACPKTEEEAYSYDNTTVDEDDSSFKYGRIGTQKEVKKCKIE